MYDPFCPAAVGAKIPDGQNRTMTATFRGTTTMTTHATSGLAAFAMDLTIPYGNATAAPATFPTTIGAMNAFSNSTGGSLFSTFGSAFRVVSAGFIIRAIQSANTAQGYFTIQSQQTYTPTVTPTQGDFLALDNTTVTNYPGMEHSYIFKPTNKVLARQFLPQWGSATINASSTGWPAAVVFFQGGATGANNVAIIEYFVNVEFTAAGESSIAPLLPPPVKKDPVALAGVDNLHTNMNPVLKGGVDFVGGMIKDAATTALSDFQWTDLETMLSLLAF
jgi:hypothetical protein